MQLDGKSWNTEGEEIAWLKPFPRNRERKGKVVLVHFRGGKDKTQAKELGHAYRACPNSKLRWLFCTRITACYPYRVETGPFFVPGLPHVVAHARRRGYGPDLQRLPIRRLGRGAAVLLGFGAGEGLEGAGQGDSSFQLLCRACAYPVLYPEEYPEYPDPLRDGL